MASQLLDSAEVPTICVEHLSETQAQAFRVADKRLRETSVPDDLLLAEQLKELWIFVLDSPKRVRESK
jgi:hypothetical protein